MKSLEEYVLTIPDFPKPGIMFRDLTTVLGDADGFNLAIDSLKGMLDGVDFDVIVGPESRGFILGAPLAYIFKKAFVPVRKKGKLPREVVRQEYALEYGKAEIEIHTDSIKPGQKVVIVDDLLATGGTAKAMIELVESVGAEVSALCFLIELDALKGRDILKDYNVKTLLHY